MGYGRNSNSGTASGEAEDAMEAIRRYDAKTEATALSSGLPIDPSKKSMHLKEKQRGNTFRIRAKHILLTYSQIPDSFNWEGIKDKIRLLGGECTIALEPHPQTGGQHVHAFCTHASGYFSSRQVSIFDIDQFHPNITTIGRTPDKAWEYTRKNGNILYDGVPEPPKTRAMAKRKAEDIAEVYEHALSGVTKVEKLKRIKASRPQDYMRNFNNIYKCAEYENPCERNAVPYENPIGFTSNATAYPEIENWCNQYLYTSTLTSPSTRIDTESSESSLSGESIFSMADGALDPNLDIGSDITSISGPSSDEVYDLQREREAERYTAPSPRRRPGKRYKCLIIWGQSLLGKTIWARSLGRHSYFSGVFNITEFDPECEYAIFDDLAVGMSQINYKGFLGGQHVVGMSDKYHKNRTVEWGRPCIYLCNKDPFDKRFNKGDIDFDWLRLNSVVVELDPNVPLATSSYNS